MKRKKLIMGRILTFNSSGELVYYPEGLMFIEEDGKIKKIGNWHDLRDDITEDTPVRHFHDYLIIPSFVELAVHLVFHGFPISASELQEWLKVINERALPRFLKNNGESQQEYELRIKKTACSFFEKLLSNGITAGIIYASYDLQSFDIIWKIAEDYGKLKRWFLGNIWVSEENWPYNGDYHLKNPEEIVKKYAEFSKNGNVQYILFPRSAWSCDDNLLQNMASLAQKYELFLVSHLSESQWVNEQLKKKGRGNSDVLNFKNNQIFDKISRGIFLHGAYFTDDDWKILKQYKNETNFVFCPVATAVGEGIVNPAKIWETWTKENYRILDIEKCEEYGINWGLGIDLPYYYPATRAIRFAHKLLKNKLDFASLFYRYTLGNAKILGISDIIGSLEVEKSADFLVFDITEAGVSIDEPAQLLGAVVNVSFEDSLKYVFLEGEAVYEEKG